MARRVLFEGESGGLDVGFSHAFVAKLATNTSPAVLPTSKRSFATKLARSALLAQLQTASTVACTL